MNEWATREMDLMVAIRRLHASPDGELSLPLHEALKSGSSVMINTSEAVYRLGVESVEPEMALARRLSPKEVERSRTGIREAAGSWAGVDTDAFKAYILERHRIANHPPVEL